MAVAVEGDAKQVEGILRRAQIADAVRDAAWDAFFAAGSPTEFKSRFEGLTLPTEVKAALWDAKYGTQVRMPSDAGPTKMRYAGAQPSVVPQAHELPPLPGLRQPLLNLEQFVPVPGEEQAATGYGRFIAGAERGIARAASGLTTGENIGLIGTMKAAPKVLGTVIGGTLSAAAGLYFTYEMAKALLESLPEAAKAWKARDYGRLGEILGEDAVTALLLGPAARHTRQTVRGGLPPLPMPERVTELPASEAGRARLRAEAGPGVAGPAKSREQRRATTLPPSTGRHELRSELRDLHVARLRGTAKRLGMDYEKMSPAERETLEEIQHEMNLAAWENIATPGPTWWPAEAESRRMAAVRPGVAQERPPAIETTLITPPGAEGATMGLRDVPGTAETIPGGLGEGPPPPRSRQPSNPTWSGRPAQILIPGGTASYPARYEVRELADVVASHNATTFQQRPEYWYVNDRNYSEPVNQERVIVGASPGRFQPERLITDNPDAVNGPPIIDPAGNVLGGNNRVMMLDRVYRYNPEGARAYSDMLLERAEQFGVDPVPILYMRQPILVRKLEGPPAEPQRAITDLNLDPQAELTGSERALADARRVPLQALDYLQRIMEEAGPEVTLADTLGGPRGAEIVNRLAEVGLFTIQEKPTLVDGRTGALTANAKERISKMLLGRLFRNSDQYDRTSPEIKAKLERIVAPLARVQGRPEWDITPRIQEAIDLLEELRARGGRSIEVPRRQGTDAVQEALRGGYITEAEAVGVLIQRGKERGWLTPAAQRMIEGRMRERQERTLLLDQQRLFGGGEYSPEAVAIARKLQENPLSVAQAFRQYAQEEALSRPGATGLLMAQPPLQHESFTAAFGLAPVPSRR